MLVIPPVAWARASLIDANRARLMRNEVAMMAGGQTKATHAVAWMRATDSTRFIGTSPYPPWRARPWSVEPRVPEAILARCRGPGPLPGPARPVQADRAVLPAPACRPGRGAAPDGRAPACPRRRPAR